LSGSAAIMLRAPVPGDEQRGVERVLIETAAVRASIRQLRKRARAAFCGAFRERQFGRILRQKTVAMQELRGSTCFEGRPNLDGAESSALFGLGPFRARRRIRSGRCRATRDVPVGATRQGHERADQREEHAAVLPNE